MEVGQHIHFELHNQYYRQILRDFAKENNINYKTYINKSYEKNNDSALIIHHDCNKAIPYNIVKWHDDIGIYKTYMGIYAYCKKCNGTMHSEYENKKNHILGYSIHRGKNCMEFWK